MGSVFVRQRTRAKVDAVSLWGVVEPHWERPQPEAPAEHGAPVGGSAEVVPRLAVGMKARLVAEGHAYVPEREEPE